MKRLAILTLLLGVSSAEAAFAQTQVEQDRIDTLARYTVTSPMCETLGMTVTKDGGDIFEAGLKAETATWSIPYAEVERLTSAAIERQGQMLSIDLDAAAQGAKSEAQLRGIHKILLGYGQTCITLAVDPIFSKLVHVPAGYDLNQAVTIASDSMLEAGGLASWQTPGIQARGDLMMVAGACRARIGPGRSDAIVRQYGRSDDIRVRRYYTRSFDEGLADTELNFDLAQCNRAISKLRNQISAGGVANP